MTAPTITRLSDHGPWSRYSIQDEDPSRHVTVFTTTRNGKLCIDHFMCCRASLHSWPELFEAWRGYRDIPDGFDLTEAGRAAFAEADTEHERARRTAAVERDEIAHERRMSGVPNTMRHDQEKP